MKLSLIHKVVAFTSLVTLSGVALAQGAGDGVPSKEVLRKTPPQERLTKAQQMIKDMKRSHDATVALLERTRNKDRDIAKVNCINEKLVSIKGYVKVSEVGYTDLKEANDRRDEEASVHHYSLVVIADHKVERLSGDAKLCVGDVASLDDSSEREVTVSPDIAPFKPVGDGGLLATESSNPLDGIETLDRLAELTPVQ